MSAQGTLGGIPERVTALRARYANRDARNAEVQAVRRGNFSAIAPDLFNDEFKKPIVANLIDTAAQDAAAVTAPLPAFNCSASSGLNEKSKMFADKRTKIVRNYIDVSKLQYQMTLKGKTGLALFTAGVSSFIGGTVAIVVLSTLAPMLGEVALLFGPADYFSLMVLGLIFAVGGEGSRITVGEGASLTATGTLADPRTGNFVVGGPDGDRRVAHVPGLVVAAVAAGDGRRDGGGRAADAHGAGRARRSCRKG